MSTVQNPKESGEKHEPNPIVEVLDKHTKAIVKMTAAMKKIASRLDFLEASDKQTRKERGEDPAQHPEPPGPAVAFLSDGKVAISLRFFDGHDIALRDTWEGMILAEHEVSDLLDGAEPAFESAASEIAHLFIERELKREFEPDEREDDDAPDTKRGSEGS